MPPTNWQTLRVSSNARWAIYEESFPARLEASFADHPEAFEAFDQDAAVDVLLAVAGAWPTLGCDDQDPTIRYYTRAYPTRQPTVVSTFIAIQLADEQIVVADIETTPLR